jgi:hypothetical protein
MKDLIRRILKESVDQKLESIEYVGRIPTKKMKSLLEGTKYEYIDDEIEKDIKKAFNKQKDLSSEISPLIAVYKDRYSNIRKAHFNIIIDYHFAERTFRDKTFPKSDFSEIDIDEGIRMVEENIDEIWKFISIRNLGFQDVIKLKSKNGVNYQVLVRLNTPNKINKINSYDLTLFNQIKGDGKDFTKDKRILKVFNPNQKK